LAPKTLSLDIGQASNLAERFLLLQELVIVCFLHVFTFLSMEKVSVGYNMVWMASSEDIYLLEWYSVIGTKTEGNHFIEECLTCLGLHNGPFNLVCN
jgi:hypothetical protein